MQSMGFGRSKLLRRGQLEDASVASLSCRRVAERIGLARYGEPLDPDGTRKAARELTRILRLGDSLYFSLPVGKPRVSFNAHRIHSPQQIVEYFSELRLEKFAEVDDKRAFHAHADPAEFNDASYACGLLHFVAA